ncbi:MAG: di-trans,poly-cis-decaprenylcistransferase [Clostridia bacterium]|nr:di-trans,poly-cis-decaprenylcistransferase [Clostridia bacterium]
MTNQGLNHQKLPLHVGIIMDGNRRWAKKNGLPVYLGHSRGAEVFKSLAIYCNKIGLKYLTVYAFSTENWKRSAAEVSALMILLKKYLNKVIKEFSNENMKMRFLGDISAFSPDIQKLIQKIEKDSENNTGLQLNIAISYGSKSEILRAAKNLAKKVRLKEIDINSIDDKIFSENLYTNGGPDVDLLIRTGGEKRISNFMLWQCAYAEFYFTDVLWPDFSEKNFNSAIEEYFSRTRRFGGA